MNKKIFLTIGIFWLVLILGFIAIREYTLREGYAITLKTVPVDPRDLFRGDYVVLRYDISTLDLTALSSDTYEFHQGDTVYVALDIVDGYGVASGVYSEPPRNTLFIKGRAEDDITDWFAEEQFANALSVSYGIESYFVPEGEGIELEQARGGALEVIVAIDKNGNSGIKSLLLDGKEMSFE